MPKKRKEIAQLRESAAEKNPKTEPRQRVDGQVRIRRLQETSKGKIKATETKQNKASRQIKKTQDELQWIVAQRLLSALTIPGFN